MFLYFIYFQSEIRQLINIKRKGKGGTIKVYYGEGTEENSLRVLSFAKRSFRKSRRTKHVRLHSIIHKNVDIIKKATPKTG
tara:strand:+ start:1141 stop:1383 length:243 start_codon:yes stop_codon:yes gene_type:complete